VLLVSFVVIGILFAVVCARTLVGHRDAVEIARDALERIAPHRTQCLMLRAFNLRRIPASAALQIEVVANGVV
jgi:hypothetical protein